MVPSALRGALVLIVLSTVHIIPEVEAVPAGTPVNSVVRVTTAATMRLLQMATPAQMRRSSQHLLAAQAAQAVRAAQAVSAVQVLTPPEEVEAVVAQEEPAVKAETPAQS
jgi:hypothetical protein